MTTQQKFEDFISKGFHPPSKELMNRLRRIQFNYGIFKNSKRTGGAKFSGIDLFGQATTIYLYDADMPYLIKAHLTKLYEEQNPNPSPAMNRVFHHLLNIHNL